MWETSCQVIWRKAASPPHMDDSVVFARWHQRTSRLYPPESKSEKASRSVQPFLLHSSWHKHTLQRAAPPPLKVAPFSWGCGPVPNTWLLGPTRVHNPYDRVYDCGRLTNHATQFATTGRIYVQTAMRPRVNTFRKEVEKRWKSPAVSESRVRLAQLVKERVRDHVDGGHAVRRSVDQQARD